MVAELKLKKSEEKIVTTKEFKENVDKSMKRNEKLLQKLAKL